MEEQRCVEAFRYAISQRATLLKQCRISPAPAQNTGKRAGASRPDSASDSTVSGYLRGLLMEKGLLEGQPQAEETLLQSGALERIQSPF